MHQKLISRIALAQYFFILIAPLLFLYLAVATPETVVVRDHEELISQIQSASTIEQLKGITSRLSFLGNAATLTSSKIFSIMSFALFLFFAMSILNLIWLRKLKR